MMYIHIDIETKKSLGLSIREAWMYSALLYLSKNEPYKGSYAELAELVDFESKTSTHRIIAQLIEKGLVISLENGLKAFHDGTSHSGTESFHSGTNSFQNGTNSEKESNQRKRIKI